MAMDSKEFKKLLASINNNNAPEILDLTEELDKKQAIALAESLKTNISVHSLILARNYNSKNKLGPEIAIALASLLRINRTLQSLDLGYNQIGAEGIKSLSPAIKESRLQSLVLYGNQIGTEGAVELSLAIKESRLQSLDLYGNQIGAEGAKALSLAIKESRLQSLSLWNNQIGDEGVVAISSAIKESNLRNLDIGYNEISDEGTAALSLAIKESRLQSLNLDGNQIGDKGAEALASALKESRLQSLDLGNNEIGDDGVKALGPAIKESHLQNLNLYGNQAGAEDKLLALIEDKDESFIENTAEGQEIEKKEKKEKAEILPSIPQTYCCSITSLIMADPVFTADGHTYERETIEDWLKTKNTSPKTGKVLKHKDLTTNWDKKSEISEFLNKYPEFYEMNDVYLPRADKSMLVQAIKQRNIKETLDYLNKDPRLLVIKLERDYGAFHLASEFASLALLQKLLEKLLDKGKIDKIMPSPAGFNPKYLNSLLEQVLENFPQRKGIIGEQKFYVDPEVLLTCGAALEQTSPGNTLLHRLALKGKLQALNWVLSKKPDFLERPDAENNTVLLLAVLNRDYNLTKHLLLLGAKTQVKNHQNQSPLEIALLNEDQAILGLLVGAQKSELPALHLALALNDLPLMTSLLKQPNVVLEALDKEQRTPLYRAVETGNEKAVRLLLEKGAKVELGTGADKSTPIHLAAKQGRLALLTILCDTLALDEKSQKEIFNQKQDMINTPDVNGDTALHLAASAGQDKVIPYLLKLGAYHKAENHQSQTPIALAQTSKIATLIKQTRREIKNTQEKEKDRKIEVLSEALIKQAAKMENLEQILRNLSAKRKDEEGAKQDTASTSMHKRFKSSSAVTTEKPFIPSAKP